MAKSAMCRAPPSHHLHHASSNRVGEPQQTPLSGSASTASYVPASAETDSSRQSGTGPSTPIASQDRPRPSLRGFILASPPRTHLQPSLQTLGQSSLSLWSQPVLLHPFMYSHIAYPTDSYVSAILSSSVLFFVLYRVVFRFSTLFSLSSISSLSFYKSV